MSLMARVRRDEDREFRTLAALHGRELVEPGSPQAARSSGLRGFHERMKQRLMGGRG